MFYMDSKSQFTVDIISKVIEGKITINSATHLLQKSRRTVERYLQRYRQEADSICDSWQHWPYAY